MAIILVEVREVVDVKQDQRQAAAVASGADDLRFECFQEEAAAMDPGHGVDTAVAGRFFAGEQSFKGEGAVTGSQLEKLNVRLDFGEHEDTDAEGLAFHHKR